jgi:hypothetical protein
MRFFHHLWRARNANLAMELPMPQNEQQASPLEANRDEWITQSGQNLHWED